MYNNVKNIGLFVLNLFAILILSTCIATAGNHGQGSITTIVIDAGHGGKDPGAIGGNKTREKDVALSVSLKLGSYIKEQFPEIEVIYTRSTDKFLQLYERAKIANDKNADLFISIHANSAVNKEAYGTETFVLGLHKSEANLEVAKRENSVIEMEDNYEQNYEFNPTSPEGHIIMAMKQNAFLNQSIEFASLVENDFETRLKRKSRGVKQAGFMVLYKTTMPSVLVECGFLSYGPEEKFLASEKGQEYIASSIFRAFKTYKTKVDQSVGDKQIALVEKGNAQVKENHSVSFKIQVFASSKQVSNGSKVKSDFTKLEEEKTGRGFYRYMYGEYTSFNEAVKGLKLVRVKGYKDAFISAYENGKRVAIDDVLTYEN